MIREGFFQTEDRESLYRHRLYWWTPRRNCNPYSIYSIRTWTEDNIPGIDIVLSVRHLYPEYLELFLGRTSSSGQWLFPIDSPDRDRTKKTWESVLLLILRSGLALPPFRISNAASPRRDAYIQSHKCATSIDITHRPLTLPALPNGFSKLRVLNEEENVK